MPWTLHHEPFRHYKATNAKGVDTWNGANKQRIVSVTDVLDGGQNQLTSWAIGNALVAAERAVTTWFPEYAPAMSSSVLDLGGLAELTGLMPDAIRDDKAALGTAAHHYLARRLLGSGTGANCPVPYGYRCATEEFIEEHAPIVEHDAAGPRVERAVGDFERAVAGTYDFAAVLRDGSSHRFDLKTSNTVQPKHFAQVATYEECAVLCGEPPSDFVSVLHVTPLGDFKVYSIAVGSDEYRRALGVFDAYLAIRRGEAKLAKLIR